MKDLNKTANTLDKICHILSVAISIASVALLVGLGILAAAWLFDLDPNLVGTTTGKVELGFITLHVAESYLPDQGTLWAHAAAEMLLTFLCLIPARLIVNSFRAILAPMKEGLPFHAAVSVHFGKIARYICVFGICANLQKIVGNLLMEKAFDLHLLMLSERIPHVEFTFVFDLSFLVVSAAMLLLSYIFRYGEQLQQLSDETL